MKDNLYNLPDVELEAIEYLFNSKDLNINASDINYGNTNWNIALGSQGATFAQTKQRLFYIGIFYFENNEVPEELQNSKDYVEELSDNYWIVACNMQRP